MLVLMMATKDCDVRAEADGWSIEDTSMVVNNKPIGMTGSPPGGSYTFDCVLRAMSAGFKPVGMPINLGGPTPWWWMLVKEEKFSGRNL